MQSSDQSKFNPEATEEFIGADPNASTTASEERAREATNELMDELAELAGSITNLGKSWWNSDQRKQIEHDLRSGIDSLGASLRAASIRLPPRRRPRKCRRKPVSYTHLCV